MGRLRQLWEKVSQISFLRRVLTLAIGTAGARALMLVAMPVLTRLYTADDFGTLALFVAFFAPMSAVCALRYDGAILLPQSDQEASVVLKLSLMSVAVTSVAVLLWSLLGFEAVAQHLSGGEALGMWIVLLAFGLLGAGVYSTFYHWGLRKNALATLSKTRLVQTVAMLAVQLGWLLGGASPGGLIVGHVLGTAGGSSSLVSTSIQGSPELLRGWSWDELKRAAWKYRSFPLVTTPGMLVSVLGLQIPTFALAALFNAQVVGQFSVTVQLLSVPQTLVGLAVGHLFMRDFALKVHEDPTWLKPAFLKLIGYLTLLAIPVVITGWLAPYYLSLFFGEGWSDTGDYARILAIPLAAQLVCGTTTNLITMGLNRWQAGWDLLRVCSVFLAFFVSHVERFDISQTLVVYATVRTILYALLLLLNLIALNRFARQNNTTPNSTPI